jgi:hypothetical protein
MYKSNGGHFYRIYADKKTALKYIGDYLKYYKKETEEHFENTEVDMRKLIESTTPDVLEIVRQTQGDEAVKELLEDTDPRRPEVDSPRSLRKRLSLNLSPRRLSRSSSQRRNSPHTPRSSRRSSRSNSPGRISSRTPRSAKLSRRHKPSPRMRALLSPKSRSADNSPRDDKSSLDEESPREDLSALSPKLHEGLLKRKKISVETKQKWTAEEEYRHAQQMMELDIMLDDLLKKCRASRDSSSDE